VDSVEITAQLDILIKIYTVLIMNNARFQKDVDYVLKQDSAINVYQITKVNQTVNMHKFFLKTSLSFG